MRLKIVKLASVLILFFMMSCAMTGGRVKNRTVDCTKKANDAIAHFKAKRYSTAKTEFESMKLQCNGSTVMDTVLYYLGMADIQLKKFIEARTEMELLVQDFPNSVFYDEARFRIPYCVFRQSNSFERDQKETHEAIRLFKDLLESGNDGPSMDSTRYYYKEAVGKLAKKEYTTARFYEKLEKYEAAVVYYKTFISEYPESPYTDLAQVSIVELLVKLDRNTEAREMYDEMVAQNRNPDLVNKVKSALDSKGSSKAQ